VPRASPKVPCLPVPGKTRYWWHGGASTGPRTFEGRAASFAARDAGRAAYLARLKFFGKKCPTGRRSGASWVTPRMWQKRIVSALGMPPQDAAKLAAELVKHLKGRELAKRTIAELVDTEAAGAAARYINEASTQNSAVRADSGHVC
jgi:hypothetical protein